jgi:hypothetical protein
LATAIVNEQPPPPRPRDQAALRHWLGQPERNAHPAAPLDQSAATMAGRLREMAASGDPTASAMLDAEVNEAGMNLARVAIALGGARWAPDLPELPKQQRIDAIAATVLELTGWRSVPDQTVQAIYRCLFGDEALFTLGTEMRVEAGLRILEEPGLRQVAVPHPETGEMVLVTLEEILEHGDANHWVLAAAERYDEKQAEWHGRVGEAVRRAAGDLGIDPTGRSFDELMRLVVAAAEARGAAPAG